MQLEQAIFTSAKTATGHGYHLHARSPGLDEQLALALLPWGPSHAALAEEQPAATSLNFHPLTHGWFVLSRTVYGGPEYSARGSLQLFTRLILINEAALRGFDCHPVRLARMILAHGHLRFEPQWTPRLEPITLPDRAVSRPQGTMCPPDPTLDEVRHRLERGEQVIVRGPEDPLTVLDRLFEACPVRDRLLLSFTTGLKPSARRAFRLHFVPPAAEAAFTVGVTRQMSFVNVSDASPVA